MSPIAIHYQPIYRFISNKVANTADAEDLTQEVFIKLINTSEKGLLIKNPKSWLFTIAKNTITDYYRKKKMVLENLDEIKYLDGDIDELTLTEDQREQLQTYLRTVIDELPDEYRRIIEMSELQGLSQKEIAAELEMNYTTVRSKVQRGRQKLKKSISACCEIIQGGKGSIIGYKPTENKRCDCNCDVGKIYYL